jgi:hypothetical protein
MFAGLVLLVLIGAACSSKTTDTGAKGSPSPTEAQTPEGSMTVAAKTRVALDELLGEHVVLAAAATNAALGGRTKGFNAAAAALDANSHDVANTIAGPLKKTPEQAYEFWASHIKMFVAYTQATAKKDKAGQNKAVGDLLGYAKSFGSLVNGAIPSLPADAVEGLVKMHITGLKDVVDAQAAKNYKKVGAGLTEAFNHMDEIAKALAGALGLEGKVDSQAADVHSLLTRALGEHVFAASSATGAALGGRNSEFADLASAWLDKNSHDIANTIAAPLKKTPEQAYEFWASHIKMFVAYTQATAKKDTAGQNKAVGDLLGYANSFGALVSGAIPALPAAAVEGLVKEHITSVKAVVDAQAAKDYTKAYTLLRSASKHMDMIGGALAQAIAG